MDHCTMAEEDGTDIGKTLGQLVLSKPVNEVNQKRRLYSSHNIQVWEYSTSRDSEETSKVIASSSIKWFVLQVRPCLPLFMQKRLLILQ